MADLDYRAMCAELLAWAEHTSSHYYKQPDVLDRARALLAQPVAEGPTDEALLEAFDGEFAEFFDSSDGFGTTAISRSEWTKVARAVLARWGRPTPQPVAVPLSPSAQAVLDAYGDFEPANVDAMAAALEAVAAQGENLYDPHEGKVSVVGVEKLLAIAAELRAQ